jgi:hypothetical protein
MSFLGSIASVGECEKGYGMDEIKVARFPAFCYRMFIGKHRPKKLKSADDEILEQIIECSGSRDIKKQAYEILRDRAVGSRNLPRSVIVNEIVAVCGLMHGIIQYAKITYKMMKDK